MVEWRAVCLTIAFVSLCFICIPIKIENLKEFQQQLSFNAYLKLYNKSYDMDSEEYKIRFRNFEDARKQSEELNQNNNFSDLAYYGFTKFADISKEEFKTHYLRKHNVVRHPTLAQPNHILKQENGVNNLPKTVDWRAKGIVSKIKNQGICGACWAFSTISVVESMAALKRSNLQEFSVQEMIDCAGNGNFGCNGGDTCNLLEWLVNNKIKIKSEKDYPLILQNESCKLTKSAEGVQIAPNYTCNSYVQFENNLLNILANHGPIAVAVNALSWQYYLGGIIKFHCDNSLENLNHAVTIVGYNLDAATPYYIVRNSWGTSFGEKGYLKIAIGENVCGIAHEVAVLDVL